ncbi:hypothetical protein O6P43_004160, partial [Quillaja saponaria]
ENRSILYSVQKGKREELVPNNLNFDSSTKDITYIPCIFDTCHARNSHVTKVTQSPTYTHFDVCSRKKSSFSLSSSLKFGRQKFTFARIIYKLRNRVLHLSFLLHFHLKKKLLLF